MVVGMSFGVHRMCIWLLPKNFDIGGTVGVWAMNIIVGCLIGEVIIVWYIPVSYTHLTLPTNSLV